ncbi:MAG: septum formation protein Maf [Proteobacteria bacterium]|nr:septum formation protein Maf [Pseudomonadota bacterium]
MPDMNDLQPIILASASPRRRRMFDDLGLPFEVIPADIDEEMKPTESPEAFVRRAAVEKGKAVAARLRAKGPNRWIVSADTIVVLGERVLCKPTGSVDARRMLSLLSGQTHKVITGWAVGRVEGSWTIKHHETRVTFHQLSQQQIANYVATGEGMDKAGAYAIQGIGTFLVDRIEGSYFNVVGLPISHVVRALIQVGALPTYPMP